jgi:hypothetical protein
MLSATSRPKRSILLMPANEIDEIFDLCNSISRKPP